MPTDVPNLDAAHDVVRTCNEREQARVLISPGEKIDLGNGVALSVVSVKGGAARIGVEAPAHVRILREEIARPASRTRARRMLSRMAEPTEAGRPRIRFKQKKVLAGV